VETLTATRISLGLGCSDPCDKLTGPLFMQLSKGYDECAVLPIPTNVQEWRDANRTARKRDPADQPLRE
jgi:hypothetical protein